MTSQTDNWNRTLTRTYENDFPLLMPKWGYALSAFVLFLIGFFGFFLNLMVIMLMFKDRQLWTPLNIIIFNLVCSDFFVAVFGNPLTLTSSLFHGWIFGDTLCVLYGFFMALFGIASITTLTVLSFERYLMVTKPLSTGQLSTKGAVMFIVFIWVYSLALTTPPLLGWGNYVSEAANISCSVNWHEQSFNTLTYILFLFAMGQIVPLAVITFSYVNIIKTMKKNSKRLGRVSRAESKVTVMVLVMIVAFTVAWTPYSIFALMEQFATEGIVSPGAGVIPALVAKSSICYDPLIYVGMNTQFRQSVKKILGMHSKGGFTQTEGGNHNTCMSPTPKLSNDITKYNITDTTLNETIRNNAKSAELSTIQESRSVEGEGNTVDCKASSGNENNINESCEVECDVKENKVKDVKRLYAEENKDNIEGDSNRNAKIHHGYGNDAFENHTTDVTESDHILERNEYKKVGSRIKQSYSLDMSNISNDKKKRRLSIEARLETFILAKGVPNSVTNRLLSVEEGKESFRKYLFNAKCKEDFKL